MHSRGWQILWKGGGGEKKTENLNKNTTFTQERFEPVWSSPTTAILKRCARGALGCEEDGLEVLSDDSSDEACEAQNNLWSAVIHRDCVK